MLGSRCSPPEGDPLATLQLRNGSYRVLFCYRDQRHSFTVGRVDRREAELAAAGVERILLRIDQGLLEAPSHDDIVAFVRRDGRAAPQPPPASRTMSLGELRERYLETHGNGAIESSTLRTARTHLDHVVATLGADFALASLKASHLQQHIDRRAKAKGRRGRPLSPVTIRKELATLRASWNWALDMRMLTASLPGRGLIYPKTDEKPPSRPARRSSNRSPAAASRRERSAGSGTVCSSRCPGSPSFSNRFACTPPSCGSTRWHARPLTPARGGASSCASGSMT